MKRVLMFAVVLSVVPALAAGQSIPPPPPPPPVPRVTPVPPVPPAPRTLVVPRDLDVRINDAIRLAQTAVQTVDVDQVRELARHQAELAQHYVDLNREYLDQVRDMRVHFDTLSDFHWDAQSSFTLTSGSDYRSGLSYIDRGQYAEAIARFDRVITQKTSSADGALYWKAFAQYKLGKTDDAVATLAQLRREYDKSGYLKDAQVLEADARQRTGQPVDVAAASANDEILLYAINGMMASDPARAIPLLADLLGRTNSLRVKNRALYVLALSDQAPAHQILLTYAKGGGNPDLQREAIKQLATGRNKQTTAAELLDIYRTSTDPSIKMTIINALGASRNRDALISVVNNVSTPVTIRSGAVSNLTNLLSPSELFALYQREESTDLRLQMVSIFSSMGAVEQLSQIAKTDKDPAVRQRAIRSLGSQKIEKTGQMLVDAYTPDLDRASKTAVINGLSGQNNAEGLVAIARKEPNIEMRTAIVSKLVSLAPKSKAAADYLEEIIKKR